MRKFTKDEEKRGDKIIKDLSEKAQKFYLDTDSLSIYEYEIDDDDECKYAVSGCYEAENMTFDELNDFLRKLGYGMDPYEVSIKYISLNNGGEFLTAEEAMKEIDECDLWDFVAQLMDDEIREKVHMELAPCSNLEFLKRYLEIADFDIILG